MNKVKQAFLSVLIGYGVALAPYFFLVLVHSIFFAAEGKPAHDVFNRLGYSIVMAFVAIVFTLPVALLIFTAIFFLFNSFKLLWYRPISTLVGAVLGPVLLFSFFKDFMGPLSIYTAIIGGVAFRSGSIFKETGTFELRLLLPNQSLNRRLPRQNENFKK